MHPEVYNLYPSTLFCIADTWIATIKVTFEVLSSRTSIGRSYFLFCSTLNLQKSSSQVLQSFHQHLAPTHTLTSHPASLNTHSRSTSAGKQVGELPLTSLTAAFNVLQWMMIMPFYAGHQLSHTYRALLRSYLLEPSLPRDTHPSPSVVI